MMKYIITIILSHFKENQKLVNTCSLYNNNNNNNIYLFIYLFIERHKRKCQGRFVLRLLREKVGLEVRLKRLNESEAFYSAVS